MSNLRNDPPFLRKSMYKFIKDPGDVRIGEVVKRDWISGDVGILGVPWDGAVGTRPGSRLAPSRIRSLLYTQPYTFHDLTIIDFGDVDVVIGDHNETWRRTEATVSEALGLVKELIVIGGDSTISYATFRGLRRTTDNLAYILFDAHPDVRLVDEGLTSGQVVRWIRSISSNAYIAIIGVRKYSNAPYLFSESEKLGIKVYTMDQVDSMGIEAVVNDIENNVKNRITHVSINLDVVDPAFAPGVNSPSPGGFTSREVIRIIAELSRRIRPRVFDVVEVTPPFDNNDLTSMLASVIIMNAIWVKQLP
ncbi:arginase family protein [Caldivirga maquilingensis]|uniref:Arginase/agmatinase/formiminoglutamase n=1 Tax=Caldivirga maquilingensis (strain ATCC 700844 / DSM 13496 / JCM 10307 / IC-167) TaxID=397948 RepID=A8M9E7_CALMQ|nr:arginase family protein [Caldivirga maquilingensis]ABW02366.1 Arginase/agmatinase/formiminoglutamase [Caldivirga maquilingensis IC-167]